MENLGIALIIVTLFVMLIDVATSFAKKSKTKTNNIMENLIVIIASQLIIWGIALILSRK